MQWASSLYSFIQNMIFKFYKKDQNVFTVWMRLSHLVCLFKWLRVCEHVSAAVSTLEAED